MLALALSLLLAAFRCWRTSLFFLLGALALNWYGDVFPLHPITQLCFDREREDADRAHCLRILAYNAFGTGHYFSPLRQDVAGTPEFDAWIASYNPDLVLLEEYQHSVMPYSVDTLSTHYPYSSWNVSSKKAEGNGHDLVLSRYPLHDFHHVKMPKELLSDSLKKEWAYPEPLVQSFHVDAPQGEILVVQCHLKSNDYTSVRKKVLEDSTKVKWMDGLNDYIESTRRGYYVRPLEAQAIVQHIQETEQWQGPVIIAGDLNDIGGSPVMRYFETSLDLKDAWWQGGLGFGFTYDAHYMLLRLDHVLYSHHFSLCGIYVDNEAAFSDHRPIVADLEW